MTSMGLWLIPHHRRDQVPAIYRWAADRKGLFVNPALTEPFGLTLLEAAASGLPIGKLQDDGGPRDIHRRCENGLLVDVTDLIHSSMVLSVLDQILSVGVAGVIMGWKPSVVTTAGTHMSVVIWR